MDENCSKWEAGFRKIQIKVILNEKKDTTKIIKLRTFEKGFERLHTKWF